MSPLISLTGHMEKMDIAIYCYRLNFFNMICRSLQVKPLLPHIHQSTNKKKKKAPIEKTNSFNTLKHMSKPITLASCDVAATIGPK